MPSQRKLGTLLILLVIRVCLAIPAFAFQNEPDEFRGIKWGTNIRELPNMDLSKDAGESKYYHRRYEKMRIADAELEQIDYGFYKGRFLSVTIYFKGDLNFDKLKTILDTRYGDADLSDFNLKEYIWVGRSVNISFGYKQTTKKGIISYLFKPITEGKGKDQVNREKLQRERTLSYGNQRRCDANGCSCYSVCWIWSL